MPLTGNAEVWYPLAFTLHPSFRRSPSRSRSPPRRRDGPPKPGCSLFCAGFNFIANERVGQGPRNLTGPGQNRGSDENSPPRQRGGKTASRGKGGVREVWDSAGPFTLGWNFHTVVAKKNFLGCRAKFLVASGCADHRAT